MGPHEVLWPVPPYDKKAITRAWWYCLHCRHSAPSLHSAQTHVKNSHLSVDVDDKPVQGEDYTNGDHLLVLIARWETWSLTAADRFAKQLDSLRGADDFELEVGDGVPE